MNCRDEEEEGVNERAAEGKGRVEQEIDNTSALVPGKGRAQHNLRHSDEVCVARLK